MDLKKYVSDAVRTESKIEQVQTNAEAIEQILNIIVAAGSMLDQYKKNVFYNKPFNVQQFQDHVRAIKDGAWYFRDIDSPLVTITHPTEVKEPTQINPRLFHAVVGAITESAELAEALKKALRNNVDPVNILEEFGDINWYEAIAVDELDANLQQILERNIAKLKARFPDKFTSENAINRNLEAERNILEGNS